MKKEKVLGQCAIILFLSFRVSIGAIWETEEAFIIDDLPEDNDQPVVTESTIGHCVDSKGAQGKCVPVSECNPFYDFFEAELKKSVVLEGFERYLNGTDNEPCNPSNNESDNEINNGTSFVCCTTLKYANVKSISLKDYVASDPNFDPNEVLPKIPEASPNEIITPPSKIVNGSPATVGEFPYAVAIISGGRQMCGGSLIDSKWVVSAAHCFDRFTSAAVKNLIIKVGDHDISHTREVVHQDHAVTKLVLHKGFFRKQGFFTDDIALIRLRTPVSVSSARTIALHTGSPNIDGQHVQAVICGWGKVCDGGCSQSTVLRKATVGLVSNNRCGQTYRPTQAPPIIPSMVCAGGSGSDTCNGDSGGPLAIYNRGQTYLIGIVSWGIGCGQYPGVYTRVSSYTGWIHKHQQKAPLNLE